MAGLASALTAHTICPPLATGPMTRCGHSGPAPDTMNMGSILPPTPTAVSPAKPNAPRWKCAAMAPRRFKVHQPSDSPMRAPAMKRARPSIE